MKIAVGCISKKEDIKQTILDMEDMTFTYEGMHGLNMIFHCDNENEKLVLRCVKDHLKTLPQLGGIFYNISPFYEA